MAGPPLDQPLQDQVLLGLGFGGGPAPPPMVDISGWPTVDAVLAKLGVILNVDGVTDAVKNDIQDLLDSVIEEFQSPMADGEGGTGRLFTPTPMTKYYDGHGFPSLRIDDIAADDNVLQPPDMVVTAFGTALTDVMLWSEPHRRLGRNVLVRRQAQGTFLGVPSLPWGNFPIGKQNISVSATFGFALQVPKDIWEAVRCEVSARAIRQGAVPLTGVGEIVNAGTFSINTASGISVWEKSSPIALLQEVYRRAVRRYRDRGHWRRQRMATIWRGRMS